MKKYFSFFLLAILCGELDLKAQILSSVNDVWTVTQFGAVADGITDNTKAFQDAIDSASRKGGKVSIPSGKWLIKGSINVKPGVSLVGTNISTLSPYQLTGSVILATGNRDHEDADPLFQMWNASAASGFTVYYPDQNTKDVHAYPWTFYISNPPVLSGNGQLKTETFDVTIENITLINSYNGIRCGPNENGRHRIMNIAGCVLRRGIQVDWTGDVGRIENIQFHSHFWFHPSVNGNWDDVFHYMQEHLEAFIFGRSDWEYVTNTFVFPAKIGYHFIKTSQGNCNGQFSGIGADATEIALLAESVQSQGLQISNGEFNSHHIGLSTEVFIGPDCEGSIRFSNCGFWGPAEHNVVIEGNSSVSFQNCLFSTNYISADKQRPNYSVVASNGKLQIQSCIFDGAQTDEQKQWNYVGKKRMPPAVLLKKGVRYAIITGNIGYEGVPVSNQSGRKMIISDNEPANQQ
jgi:hypothetical protein